MYTIKDAKNAIKNGIKGYLLKDDTGEYVMQEVNRLPFYLEGKPGIGKTEIVRQVANELNIGYVSFSLVHHTRNSVLGLPVIKEFPDTSKYTSYTISEIIAKVLEERAKGYEEGILLLDEFPCMSETILPIMLAFLQTKNIGTHTLPKGWVIVLCGNPPEYNFTARRFDAAIVDRIRKIDVDFEGEVFLEYGKRVGLHEIILEYIKTDTSRAYRYCKNGKELEIVTCRGWENLSHMMKTYELLGQDISEFDIRQYIKSEDVAKDFYFYYTQCIGGLKYEDYVAVFEGKNMTKYVSVLEGKSMSIKWKVAENIFKVFDKENKTCIDATYNELKYLDAVNGKYKKIFEEDTDRTKAKIKASEQISNIIKYLKLIDEDKMLIEIAYNVINKNLAYMQILSEHPCEEFLKLCTEKYKIAI